MAMNKYNESIIITIPSSEIIAKCRISGPNAIKKSDVTGYYTNDFEEKRNEIVSFFDGFKNPFVIDSSKMSEYKKCVSKYILPKYRNMYVNNMDSFESLINNFISKDVDIPSMFFSGETGRYLKFQNDNPVVKDFKEVLYDGIANLVIEKKDNCFKVYAQFRYDFYTKLNVPTETIVDKDNEEYNKFKHLLAFFVNQLRINNDLVKGEPHSGKGYRGEKIRELYEKYREYDGFTLDCTIQSGYNRTSSGANYVHNGGTNIRPNFNLNKDVEYLYLDLYKKENPSDAILELLDKKYSINDLDLFSEGEPTSTLIELFDDYKLLLSLVNEKDHAESKIEKDSSKYLKTGENVILYGVPGSGKSYKVKHEYLAGLGEEQHERVVFHPDYTYSDFVGQILPEKGDNGSLTYKFNPGPFTRIMKKAYESPDKKFVLVIEEINRGNAPAIFGDIFQLLDREKEGDEEGFSEYSITNHEIGRELFDDEDAKIKIPSNLSIIATMNTSDQNVFTLDNAFQRRWKMVQVANVFDKSKKEEKDLAETKVLDTDLIWEDFMKIINEQILNKNLTMTSMEDKRLGTHFVDKNLLKDDRQFSGKVLKYLWDDGFKFARNDVFNSEFKTLEDLTEKFVSNSGQNRLDIFNESVKKAIDDYLEDIKNRESEEDGENF